MENYGTLCIFGWLRFGLDRNRYKPVVAGVEESSGIHNPKIGGSSPPAATIINYVYQSSELPHLGQHWSLLLFVAHFQKSPALTMQRRQVLH